MNDCVTMLSHAVMDSAKVCFAYIPAVHRHKHTIATVFGSGSAVSNTAYDARYSAEVGLTE